MGRRTTSGPLFQLYGRGLLSWLLPFLPPSLPLTLPASPPPFLLPSCSLLLPEAIAFGTMSSLHFVHTRRLPFQANAQDIVKCFAHCSLLESPWSRVPVGRPLEKLMCPSMPYEDTVAALLKDCSHVHHQDIQLFLNSYSKGKEDIQGLQIIGIKQEAFRIYIFLGLGMWSSVFLAAIARKRLWRFSVTCFWEKFHSGPLRKKKGKCSLG